MRAPATLKLLSVALFVGCVGPTSIDFDADGWDDADDCAPADALIHPDAADPWSDGVDQNCDGFDGIDGDGDGYPSNPELQDEAIYDCNDENDAVHPGAVEVPGTESTRIVTASTSSTRTRTVRRTPQTAIRPTRP